MAAEPSRLDAFICYSRRDLEFASRLYEELAQRGRSTWIDLEGIPPTAEWWEEIQHAIREAANFVVVLTAEAVGSPECRREIDYAKSCGKRLITLLAKEIDGDVPEAIAKVQWIDGRDLSVFESTCAQLVEAFDTDLDLVRWHARVLTRAHEWEHRSLEPSLLLRGTELREAVERIESGTAGEPRITSLQERFIESSKKAQQARGRRRLVVATLVIAILAALASWGWWQVHRRSRERLSEEIAARSRSALPDNAIASLILSLDALEAARTPAALQALSSALSTSRVRGTLLSSSPATVAAAYLPDGSAVATLGEDGTVQVYATETKLPLAEFVAPLDQPITISFSVSGHRLFVTGLEAICAWGVPDLDHVGCWQRDTMLAATHTPGGESILLSGVGLQVIDIGGGGPQQFPGLETSVCGETAVSPDGRVMAIAVMPPDSGNAGVVLVVRDDGGEIAMASTPEIEGLPKLLAVSEDGTRLLAVDEGDRAILSDTATGEILLASEHPSGVLSAGFSPRGRWAIVADEHGRVVVSDATIAAVAGDFMLVDPRLGWTTVVELVNDLPWIVAGGGTGFAIVYDIRGRELFPLSGGSEMITGVAISPDGRSALTYGAEDLVWDLDPTAAVLALHAHDGSVEAVRFIDDGAALVTGGADGRVLYWELGRPPEPVQLGQHDDWIMAVESLQPRSRVVISAGLDGVVRILDLDSPSDAWFADLHRAEAGDPDRAGWIWDLALVPGMEEMVTVGEDGVIVRSALDPPRILDRLMGDGTPLTAVAVAAGGTPMAVGDEAGRVTVMRSEEAEEVALEPHQGPVVELDFSPDAGKLLSVAADGKARVFETASWDMVVEVTEHTQPLLTGGFSPSGGRFLTAGFDTAVLVWDAVSGDLACELDGHLDAVSSAIFLAEDRVVTGGSDGRVRVWEIPEGRLLALVELNEAVRAMDIADDGRVIAVALADGRVFLWPCPLCGEIDEAITTGYETVAPLVAQIEIANALPSENPD